MRILFLGDVVGRVAREKVIAIVPHLRENHQLDFVIVNGENAARGFGITEKIAHNLFDAGVDVITLGNHAWDQREVLSYIGRESRLLRPCNYPLGTVGKGSGVFETKKGQRVLVVNVMGQLFMEALDNPFIAVEKELVASALLEVVDAIVIDIHAEASSEKMAMGHFCDGRVSLVVGTHTHIPTADAHILNAGTAYQTDAGMCGDYDSVVGMEKEESINRFVTKMRHTRFTPALSTPTICGVFVKTDDKTGLATQIQSFRQGGCLTELSCISES